MNSRVNNCVPKVEILLYLLWINEWKIKEYTAIGEKKSYKQRHKEATKEGKTRANKARPALPLGRIIWLFTAGSWDVFFYPPNFSYTHQILPTRNSLLFEKSLWKQKYRPLVIYTCSSIYSKYLVLGQACYINMYSQKPGICHSKCLERHSYLVPYLHV